MDATNVTAKQELPASTDVTTDMDFLPQDVDENSIEMKTFAFDDDDCPLHLAPSEVSAIVSRKQLESSPSDSAAFV